ncbi:MAG: hypothetical protein JO086_16860 [Acidimicrobiia bacterium]|nr:hypothetical protein [Acidimicrobiia bacterium]
MGTLFGFAVGYVIGARAGSEGFDDLLRAMSAIRQSEEYRGFVTSLREHVMHTLRDVNQRLAAISEAEDDDPVARARARLRD